jgi:hypothetical protein
MSRFKGVISLSDERPATRPGSGFPGPPLLLGSGERGAWVSDVFISYSRDNQEAVRQLAEAVKALGYDVWWDDQLPPHLAYGDVIAQKVGGAKAAIVVWSANATASEWVRAEADMARSQRKLIQTTLDGAEPPMPFNQLHYVSLADWQGEPDHPGWSKVRESLVALAGQPAGAAPDVPPPLRERTVPPAAAPLAAAAAAAPPPAPEPAPPVPATPAPAPPPPPPPTSPVAPAPRSKGGNKLLIIIIVLAVLIIGTVGVLALMKGRGGPADGNNMAAENGTAPANEAFNQEAVLQGEDEFANVRSAPAADAPIVARINAGESFNTYQQDGIWWRVQIRGGLVGYLERAHIRTRAPVAVPPLEPAPGNQTAPASGNQVAPGPAPTNTQQTAPPPQQTPPQQRPPRQDRPPRVDPRINQENAGIMYDFCKGAGAGTPQCRQLGLSGPRRRRQAAD